MKQYAVSRAINASPETIWGLLTDAPGYAESTSGQEASKASKASARDTDLIIEALKKRRRKVVLVLKFCCRQR